MEKKLKFYHALNENKIKNVLLVEDSSFSDGCLVHLWLNFSQVINQKIFDI